MSSMVTSTFLVPDRLMKAALVVLLSTTAVASAQSDAPLEAQVPVPPAENPAMVQPIPGSPNWNAARAQVGVAQDGAIVSAINEWRRLQQSDGLGFSAYASFITTYPDWPGEDRMRRLAETSINPISYEPAQVVAFFARFPARTATGHARNAVALSALGRMGEAKIAARNAWITGALAPEDEARILSLFGSSLTTADHDRRADVLLFARASAGAERMLAYVSANRRPVFAARIALQRKAPTAATLMQAAEAYGAGDPGFLADKAMWLRDSGNSIAARTLLANRPALSTQPGDPEKWFETLLTNARAAANDSQWSFAFAIAAKLDDAYPAGVAVRDKSLGERDDYTSLAWLAGTTAYYNLARPRDAQVMFERYANAARSPQTMSKGYYWAGRAALAGNDAVAAGGFFTQAAAYPDQFYGQLALERLGRPVPAPPPAVTASPTPEQRAAFAGRSVVRAAKALGQMGYWEDQSKFLRAIAASANDAPTHALSTELAQAIGRPDLGVMVGRRTVADGMSSYGKGSFPSIAVPSGHQANWTMIHAIARQESQFDRAAISHAGARGLMQLMPGTARETAGKIGLSYSMSALTSDPAYNIQLGSTYFQQMLNYYGGSYPLAVAAYNAGPGNVNKWIAANGDPRLAGSDMLRWIEQIPIFETRNYVQRVLENAVVYDAINPAQARFRGSTAPLSRYLGKNVPG
ncbi:lytic transglycosylase domain-containing protein [Sphingobium algorifonticola]|uniref:Lytic transglycosylase domain-containing protein n=1 Tax=Sphingobium algorifonticola TaxID=2008318 RepID=A0A437J8A3_9SPHN|nr:lytic transglycosylase domain-containing protein [Sphingobium algorifonticola]RVT41739.1 lytic transglycosylase domain-containing protein [Sphingobium algorifonticola]